MQPARALAALAARLGVEDPRDPRRWLVRVFVLPPSQSEPWPAPVQAAGRHLRATAARGLRIPEDSTAREWLLATVFAGRPAGARPGLVDYLLWLIAPLLHVLGTPMRLVQHALERIDFEHRGRQLEAVARRKLWDRRGLRLALIAGAAGLFWIAATTPLALVPQLAVLGCLWGTAMLVRRLPGDLPSLVMVGLSLVASARYICWRLATTLELYTPVDIFFGTGLLLAEVYTWLIMLLGYVQNAWPLRRPPVLLPPDPATWPTVDVYVPTYNEPLAVVKPTVLACLSLDWPADKLRVWILDDGRREEFRQFAQMSGAQYLTRSDNRHAKAGNLNHALQKTDGDYIAIFDCDHIPTRSFLQIALGWFLKDPRCAMLQTPHHFFSPDPFERNLKTFRRVPNEGNLFYGLVQDGNDLWNAAFFCGSCAVLRRGPLEEIGGIAVETVTEDAHTALKLHRRGYTTAYLNLTQAAGLATESLSAHVGQRIRWARGMAQIFRIDNPLLGRGLTLFQRLCYSNAMLHFFYGIPRLVFLTAPLAYLYFEAHVMKASAAMLAAYVAPHLVLSSLANSRLQGRFRHSFWAEAYETVLAWYIALPTTMALINPRLGKFNVTAKGGLVERQYFDWQIATPFILLAGANLLGFCIGIGRLFWWNAFEAGTVALNLSWTIYNLIMLGTAMGVAAETRQVRRAHRIALRLPAQLELADGRRLDCHTTDFSTTGLGFEVAGDLPVQPGDSVGILLQSGSQWHPFPATVTGWRPPLLGLRLQSLSLEDEKQLVQCTFGRADAWMDWSETQDRDRPLSSLGEVLSFGLAGYLHVARNLPGALRDHVRALLRLRRRRLAATH